MMTGAPPSSVAPNSLIRSSPDELPIGALGRVAEIRFDSVRWQTPQGSCDLTGVPDSGLDTTGLTLVETGVFEGSFQIPWAWCRSDDASPESTVGLNMGLSLVDFRHPSLDGVIDSTVLVASGAE